MPNPRFPGPSFDTVPDSSEQTKRVDLDHTEMGSRKSTEPKKMDVGLGIKHVGGRS